MNMKQYELEEGCFSYINIEENETVRITSYQGNQTQVVIPESIEGHPVTEIGKKTFLGKKTLKKVIVPKSVTLIEDWAFANSNQLEEVILENENVRFGKGVFQGCKSLQKMVILKKNTEFSQEEEEQIGALLAATVNLLDTPHLFRPDMAGEKEWLSQWDARMLNFMRKDDHSGFTVVVLCGEEDYGSEENSLSYFLKQKRKAKVRLAFLRLKNSMGITEETKEELTTYLKEHTKGCETEEAWEVILEEHGNEKEYYEILMECDGITNENFDGFLEDFKDNYPEMKAFLMKYKEETLGYGDFFGALSLEL